MQSIILGQSRNNLQHKIKKPQMFSFKRITGMSILCKEQLDFVHYTKHSQTPKDPKSLVELPLVNKKAFE